MKTPIRALFEGLLAGAAGAALQTWFFQSTQKLAPKPPKEAFAPPEPQQRRESELETTARRLVEGLAQRGPLDEPAKKRLGQAVHYGFGAAWGGLYGLLRASFPSVGTLGGTALYATAVWIAGDDMILPAFKLAAWPHKYPLRSHAYAITAHLVYGAGLWSTTELFDRASTLALLVAAIASLPSGKRLQATRALVPKQLIDGPRHLAEAVARRARDLTH